MTKYWKQIVDKMKQFDTFDEFDEFVDMKTTEWKIAHHLFLNY